MRIKTVLFFIAVLAVLLLFSSCIIINQPEKSAEDGISTPGNDSQDGEAGQSTEPDLNETDTGTIDEIAGELGDEFSDMIRVSVPSPDQLVTSPLIIKGEARGTWFFEASFPVKLLDAKGNVIVEYYAQTDQDWMTEDFISFTSQIEFDTPGTETGTLVLMKDNPSDLREYDAQIEIPVRFR